MFSGLKWGLLLSGALPVLLAADVSREECSIFVDQQDFFSFGSARLGDSQAQVPQNSTKSKECLEDRARNYFDCEYTDQEGVSYLVEGTQIIRKEIRTPALYQKELIGGVRAADTLIDVVRKLASLPPDFPQWSIKSTPDDKIILATGTCLLGSNGYEWSYYFGFDGTGHLKLIGARGNW